MEVVIRAKDGTGRANLIVGKTGASAGTTIAGTVDFTGGTVDALVYPTVPICATSLGDDEVGNLAPALAMASAWHETQYSRLFQS